MKPQELKESLFELPKHSNYNIIILTASRDRHNRFALKIQKEFPDARVKSLLPGGGFTKTKAIAKGVTIGELASQATMDPETAAVGEFIGKYVGDDAGALSTLLEYMTADESKTDLENRLALLLDGLGDGIFISAENCGSDQNINQTAFGILQATRTRISKTEYISCPSCGRTLFDLQETTAKIRAKTNHLKAVSYTHLTLPTKA